MAIKTVTKDNFKTEVLDSPAPILVEFWAPWCGYCKRLAPVMERLAEKLGDDLHIASINYDDSPSLAEQYGVDTLPTLLLFKNGQPGQFLVAPGAQAQIEAFIREQL